MTGSLEGALRGALFGAISAGVAYGVAEVAGHLANVGSAEAHAATLMKAGLNKLTAIKTMLHGLSRGIIARIQGGSFKAGFMSGLSSAFDVGTKGYGGFVGRTTIMAIVGGTAAALGGGKFANGAVSAAFVHMFNGEYGSITKAFRSLARGLYRFGDYVGRISGFRDWQDGSIVDRSYYQDQALSETKAVYILGTHVVENPKLSLRALSVYYNMDSAQMNANSLVNFYTGLAVPGVGIISLVGNTMGEAHAINQIYRDLRN